MTNASNLQSSLYKLFVKHAPAAIAICDTRMRYLAHSDRWSRDYGLKGKSLVGQCHYDLFPDLPNHWKEEHQRCFRGETIQKEEEPFPRGDGSVDWVRRELHPWKNGSDEIAGLIMFTEVVTERKQAQEAQRESEKKYRRLMENGVMGVYQVHRDGRFIMVNQRMAEIFGFESSDDFLNTIDNIKSIYLDPSDRPKILEEIDHKGFIERKQAAFKGREGNTIWLHLNTRRTLSHTGSVLYEGFVEDVTQLKQSLEERERLQNRLLRTQKAEAIASLAGGIAHEFNNALVGITGNIELLKMDFPGDMEQRPYLDSMMTASRRMAHLTDKLLAYARGGKYEAKTLSLPTFLNQTLAITSHSLNPSTRLKTDIPSDIYPVYADPTQLQMVISAILNNAGEAIKEDGCINIHVRNRILNGGSPEKTAPLKPGSYIRITIEDNGKGMDKETLSRVFDPFFTTKFQGRGMGMGRAPMVLFEIMAAGFQ